MVINIDNIIFSVAHADNEELTEEPSLLPKVKKSDSNVVDYVTANDFSEFKTATTQQLAEKTSLFGIDTGNILIGSIILEVLLFVVLLILLKDGLGRLSKRLTKQDERIEALTHNAAQQKMFAPVTNWPAPPKPVVETQIFSAPRPIERMPEPRPITAEDKYKDFVKDFNALVGQSGINLKNARSDFMRKYNVQTFTCTNFEARMNEPVPAPVFDSANSVANPDYWAYEFESGVFAVVPNVKIYSDNHHTAGRSLYFKFHGGQNV